MIQHKRALWSVCGVFIALGLAMVLGMGMTMSRASVVEAEELAAPALQSTVDWPHLQIAPIAGAYDGPVQVTHAGDGSGRIFVVERTGRIRIVQNGTLLDTPFLDIHEQVDTQGECGLLSLAFPPDFAETGFFFVYYNHEVDQVGPITDECDTVVARFSVGADPNVADPASESQVLVIDQPYNNHNGGQIAFGPDGYLYIGMGDGGNANDPLDAGQSADTLLGKILRIDVRGDAGGAPECSAVNTNGYRIPADNPLVDGDGGACDEIWALGLRNPWRFSFDRSTGDLYIADVGQNRYEEINVQPASSSGGENYGWNVMEGLHCFRPPDGCDTTGLTLPVTEYDHEDGLSVSGGVVYRGAQYPRMAGVYFYGDFITGRIWGLQFADGEWHTQALLDTGAAIAGFGEDETGNIYMADLSGTIYQLFDLQLDNALFLPVIQRDGAPIPEQELEWDPRLDQRGAVLIPATVTPGAGYWKLIQAVWFDVEESGGRHHIFVETLDETSQRQTGVPVLIQWPEGTTTITTQAKPGEPYAADFGMFSIAPAYSARPDDGVPADKVDGMGMGNIDEPFLAHHTSYGLTWQWTVAGSAATPTPSVTPTATITPTSTPTVTITPTVTPPITITQTPVAATPTPSATLTPTVMSTPTITPTGTITPTITPTVTPTTAMLVLE